GVFHALTMALDAASRKLSDLDLIRINEAAPVIGDVAMETISETIITESTMIGHNPTTPGGLGIGVGTTIPLAELEHAPAGTPYIVVADRGYSFEEVASRINAAAGRVDVTGAILQRDDGVLVHNRLLHKIPIVDEVGLIEKVPLNMLAAIEVSEVGRIIETLANPYGIATLFGLDSDETASVVPMARSLVGNRSALVIKTPKGDVTERRIPAGSLTFIGGGLAGEFSLEAAVGIAAMVKADRLQMQRIAHDMTAQFGIQVEVGGVEADMAVRGALTTPGSSVPIAILDMGAGSTDASVLRGDGIARSIHLAGAGNMVTLLIQSELGLESSEDAENVKRYPLARVETLFNIRHEDGTVQFFDTPLPPHVFARTVVLHPEGMIPLQITHPLEVIRQVRIRAKERVFVTNALRALAAVSPTSNVRDIAHVVLVGG
ncbi:MAG: diol dehydratase reactivase subunit alpha, partial [Actinobacteria bacterium]|nr:diol dehydratase reactivase subunit alpha [Actinomycetota bacterium]